MTITIQLPTELERFISDRAAAAGHATAADYIVALLQSEATEAEERRALETCLVEGLDELDRGEGRAMTAADWERMRADIRQRYGMSETR